MLEIENGLEYCADGGINGLLILDTAAGVADELLVMFNGLGNKGAELPLLLDINDVPTVVLVVVVDTVVLD